jgi:hypothetical protein
MYEMVPAACVEVVVPCPLAMPRSMSTYRLGAAMMFAGFTSRCRKCSSWSTASASSTSFATRSTSCGGIGPFAATSWASVGPGTSSMANHGVGERRSALMSRGNPRPASRSSSAASPTNRSSEPCSELVSTLSATSPPCPTARYTCANPPWPSEAPSWYGPRISPVAGIRDGAEGCGADGGPAGAGVTGRPAPVCPPAPA